MLILICAFTKNVIFWQLTIFIKDMNMPKVQYERPI